jgi:hypothetical protein
MSACPVGADDMPAPGRGPVLVAVDEISLYSHPARDAAASPSPVDGRVVALIAGFLAAVAAGPDPHTWQAAPPAPGGPAWLSGIARPVHFRAGPTPADKDAAAELLTAAGTAWRAAVVEALVALDPAGAVMAWVEHAGVDLAAAYAGRRDAWSRVLVLAGLVFAPALCTDPDRARRLRAGAAVLDAAADKTAPTRHGGSPMSRDLPTFDDIRRRAHGLLGDVQDELRSDWRPGTGPTRAQANHVAAARRHIAAAKAALDRAGR